MDRRDISQTIEAIDELRRDTRRALQSFWFPLALFGALTLLSAPFCAIADGRAVGLFWALAGPAGGIATSLHYARRETALGLSRPAAPYIVVAVGLMAGAFVLPALTTGDLQDVVSYFAVAAGYLGFAWIERDGRIAGIAAFIAAVPLVMLAVAPGSACLVTAVATGSVLVASGRWFHRSQRSDARSQR